MTPKALQGPSTVRGPRCRCFGQASQRTPGTYATFYLVPIRSWSSREAVTPHSASSLPHPRSLSSLLYVQVLSQIKKGKTGGRGIVVQDVHAPVDMVMGRILDFSAYPRMVPNVAFCGNYEEKQLRKVSRRAHRTTRRERTLAQELPEALGLQA